MNPYATGSDEPEETGSWWEALKARAVWALLAIGVSTVVGWIVAFFSGNDQGTAGDAASATCEEAAEWAVEISAEDAPFVQLLDVRGVTTVIDRRSTYKPPSATEESLVLECSGTGVWSDGSRAPVTIRVSVDADDEIWVFYEPA